MKLLIVESPAKAKTIEKYLEGEYNVKASIGHVRDLPKSNKQAIDIDNGFVPHYEISKGKESVLDEISRLSKKSEEIILATDPDREGEAIAWHLAEVLKGKGVDTKSHKIKRVTFNEITKEAVKDAMENPRDIDQNLRQAQEARRVLDRLVGYDLSGIIWKKVRYGLSAGRVQSPALRIIMEREREIKAFKSEDYFIITANLSSKESPKKKILVTSVENPNTSEETERIIKEARCGSWSIKSIETSEVKRSPKAPFITSTLQQTASTRLGFSPSRTMALAQRLYEAGHITYMRTDSTNLSKVALSGIARAVESNYGKDYLEFRNFNKKSKNAQEAHEAIRPSHFEKESAGSNEDEKRLYRLIWQRTVASQMKDARLLRTKITANIDGAKIPDFTANGSTVIFDGWLKADKEASGEEVILERFKEGENLNLIEINSEQKQTQPPGRYTEAGLIKELEKRGIGRPSTYASIIKTLEDREYVIKENKSLKPTDTGDVVSSFLEENFKHYISDDFTALMETKLDDIANGEASYKDTLSDFYYPLHKEIKTKEKLEKATNIGIADSKYECPKCGSSMMIKLGRGGKFLSCSKYPDCDGALTIDGLEIKKDTPIGNDPETNLPIYVKTGRFGPYVQLGEMPVKVKGLKSKEKPPKPKMASIPKEYDISNISVADAVKFLSLPRTLGLNPANQKEIVANRGRFGPYIVCDGDFRSLKKDNVYDIDLPRAIEILSEPKKIGRARFKKKSQ